MATTERRGEPSGSVRVCVNVVPSRSSGSRDRVSLDAAAPPTTSRSLTRLDVPDERHPSGR
jgi:hypothetical protein